MCRMIGSIRTLNQHHLTLDVNPGAYRPERCDRCGRAGLWNHGYYYRKGDRSIVSENRRVSIPIPRFLCPHCGVSCSRLPECLSPRRWYPWDTQGLALFMAFMGASLKRIRGRVGASGDTIRRWKVWLAERSEAFAFHLRSTLPHLGRHGQGEAFWSVVLREEPGLAKAMATVCRLGVVVP